MKVRNIIYDDPFEKQYKKYLKKLTSKEKEKLKKRLKLFKNDVFDKRLGTHKLKGNLKKYYTFDVSYKDRIVFKIIDNNNIYFIEIGDHDTVY